MGWGDDLMAAGEARRLHRETGGMVAIVAGPGGRPLSSPLWRGIDYIAKEGDTATSHIVDSPAHRRYRLEANDLRSIWREYQPVPAELSFTDEERRFAEHISPGFVVIEPHIKRDRVGALNRDWGWRRFERLVARTKADVRWVQLGPARLQNLPGVTRITTDSFRKACAVLAKAAAYVGPEGGLHHASAALGVPAVVIFGGYVSPKVTGYKDHTNLFAGNGLGCGTHSKCECSCMRKIKVTLVESALRQLLAKPPVSSSREGSLPQDIG